LFLDNLNEADRYEITMNRLTVAASQAQESMIVLEQALGRLRPA
jgi:hypothetical protein